MAGPYSKARHVVLIKKETTYGVDPTPAAASDCILPINPVFTPRPDLIDRQTVSSSLGRDPSIVGGVFGELAFGVELRGSGAAGTAPRGIGAFLQACGFTETVNAGVSVIYTLASDALASVTAYHYLAERVHKMLGAAGDFELILEAGKIGILNCRLMGLYSAPTGGTSLPTPTQQSSTPPIVRSAAFAYNSVSTLVVQALQIRMQNQISRRPDINAANSYKGFRLVDRDVIGSFNPEQEALADYDPYALIAAGTAAALTCTVGTTAGNICTITAPKVAIREIGQADRESILVYDHALGFGRNSGNDELQIAFT